jgi:outer membrane protein assembly factor BamE (lipoprotein component of BamABCDE complex)
MTKNLFLAAFLLFFALGCQPTVKFDSAKWKQPNALENGDRNAMADDLVNSGKLVGLTRPQMLILLGTPAPIVDTKDAYYILSTNYDTVDAVSGRDLIITFSKDSVITSAKIKVWHKKQ